ncbi:hypothetical protein MMC07_001173 [Pseudocyphellaria aurata]|nr:hypothetical protein [Pseudocyphellaria aurata]
MATGTSSLQHGHRIPRTTTPGAAPTVLQTNSDAHRDMRYSYTETPTEFQRPVFEQFSPADSMIEESPISPREGHRANLAERAMNAHFPPAKDALPQSDSPYTLQPPREVHPAHFAPYAEPAPQPEQAHHPQVPHSPGPLPIKLREEPTSPKVATVYNSEQERRRLGSPRLGQDTEHPTLVYNPDSLAGPNVAHEAHRPGQVSHPNAMVDPEWKHGLCEVDTLCCTGLFCPCIVYGKTQYRLSRKAQKQEPTDLLGYDACNSSCGIMAVACGLQGVYPSETENKQSLTVTGVFAALQRNRIRRLYKLKGNLGSDCVKAICCCPCVIMQDEREVRDREELIRRHAGPASGAYVAPGTMAYAPPPR